MIIDFIIVALWLSLLPFSFTLLVDVSLGYPGAERPDVKAIFFKYSYFLAARRLKSLNAYDPLNEVYKPEYDGTPAERLDMEIERRRTIFEAGRRYFTWEKGFGMCPVCTNIRVALLFCFAVWFLFDYSTLFFFLVPCFSNLYFLIYNKLKH